MLSSCNMNYKKRMSRNNPLKTNISMNQKMITVCKCKSVPISSLKNRKKTSRNNNNNNNNRNNNNNNNARSRKKSLSLKRLSNRPNTLLQDKQSNLRSQSMKAFSTLYMRSLLDSIKKSKMKSNKMSQQPTKKKTVYGKKPTKKKHKSPQKKSVKKKPGRPKKK
jgi:hypothetical protein